MTVLAWAALAAACVPALMTLVNLAALRPPRQEPVGEGALVSILIPARDEAASIGPCVEAALRSRGVPVEVVVMDDGSTDGTAAIVRAIAASDPRLRLLTAPPLPPGWAGKPHACQRLAEAAAGTHLLFVDADVRLEPDAASTLAGRAVARGAAMVSGVPRQRMESLGERLTVPMINLLIWGYLPVMRMRASVRPAYAAACGQLVMVERRAYDRAGGHAAVRTSLHEALKMARRLRRLGLMTDLVPGAGLASCRMYQDLASAWAGFAKNATEGMAKPVALPIWTVLLGLGHALPPLLVLAGLAAGEVPGQAWAALFLALGTRTAITLATREPLATIPLHPATVAVALAIQWDALLRGRRGRAVSWKGRAYRPEVPS